VDHVRHFTLGILDEGQSRTVDLQNKLCFRLGIEVDRPAGHVLAPELSDQVISFPRAELAIRFGVILRKVWGGSRTWAGARAQSVLMSVWRTCWQQGRSAPDSLSQLLRGTLEGLALPP
jgi:transposase